MISVGHCASLRFEVTDADTARALGSGDVDVLATPRVLAWVEAATVTAVSAGLSPDETTVGTAVELEHLIPSSIGANVVAQARVSAVKGRRIELTVEVVNPDGGIAARGRITRARVPRSRFP